MNRAMSRAASILLASLAALMFNSCATCWSGGIPLRDVEERARRQAVEDFGDTSNARVYRGLAHPQAQPELYQQQVEAVARVDPNAATRLRADLHIGETVIAPAVAKPDAVVLRVDGDVGTGYRSDRVGTHAVATSRLCR